MVGRDPGLVNLWGVGRRRASQAVLADLLDSGVRRAPAPAADQRLTDGLGVGRFFVVVEPMAGRAARPYARSGVAGVWSVSLIRGTSLTGFRELVRSLGGADPDELLGRHGIPRSAVGDFDSFVDCVGLLRLLEDAARETGTPGFGRRLADVQGIEILGVVGAAARTAGTVRHGVAIIGRYLGAYSPAIQIRLDSEVDRPGLTTFEFRIVAERLPPHAQGIELALGVAELWLGPPCSGGSDSFRAR